MCKQKSTFDRFIYNLPINIAKFLITQASHLRLIVLLGLQVRFWKGKCHPPRFQPILARNLNSWSKDCWCGTSLADLDAGSTGPRVSRINVFTPDLIGKDSWISVFHLLLCLAFRRNWDGRRLGVMTQDHRLGVLIWIDDFCDVCCSECILCVDN